MRDAQAVVYCGRLLASALFARYAMPGSLERTVSHQSFPSGTLVRYRARAEHVWSSDIWLMVDDRWTMVGGMDLRYIAKLSPLEQLALTAK